MKPKVMYMVMRLTKQIEVALNGNPKGRNTPLIYTEGMIGAVPVFETLKIAKAYARYDGRDTEIVKVQIAAKEKE